TVLAFLLALFGKILGRGRALAGLFALRLFLILGQLFGGLVAVATAHGDGLDRHRDHAGNRGGLNVGQRAHARLEFLAVGIDADAHLEIGHLGLGVDAAGDGAGRDLGDLAAKLTVRVGVDVDAGLVADADVDDVVFVDLHHDFHVGEIGHTHDLDGVELAGGGHAFADLDQIGRA